MTTQRTSRLFYRPTPIREPIVETSAKVAANNQATLIAGRLFVDLIEERLGIQQTQRDHFGE